LFGLVGRQVNFKRKCFQEPGKNRYNTQREAETALLLADKKDLRVYNCECCRGWHLTSTPEK